MKRLIPMERRSGFITYVIFSLIIIMIFVIMEFMKDIPFTKYFGGISPLIIVNLAIIFGGLLLFVSPIFSDFKFFKKGMQNRWKYLLILPAIFTAIIIVVDLVDNFPKDTNVLLPNSLFFYPWIAFVVEVIFHLLPVAIIVSILHFCKSEKHMGRILIIGLFCIALIEPTYQAVLLGTPLSLKNIYIFIHIFLINITGLWLFKKYDFFTMYSFRVSYYLLWHVIWGTIRYYLLF